ncbi:H(+)-exporting diphosphatase [Plasmodiophora brassicae]|nr:hypothetical protein PBRA_003133 [Plasmodiophora brassicae]
MRAPAASTEPTYTGVNVTDDYDYESGGAPPVKHASGFSREGTPEEFDQYMFGLIGICGFCLLVGLFAVGGVGKLVVCFVMLVCAGSFAFCSYLYRWIMSKDNGTPAMRVISDAIKEGSEGFLRVQYGTVAYMSLVVAGALFTIYMFRQAHSVFVGSFTLALVTALSFLIGAFCSALAGFVGVFVSIRVNIRVAAAAARLHYPDALQLAFRGGAVSSVLSAAMCITGLCAQYVCFHLLFVVIGGIPPQQVPMLLGGYGFGASFVALFMQLGGGIYTKAADVGADMVGKVERDIPEDDPRNPAVVADLVGDNVGDCAGSMADVFESIAAEMIGTMILAGSLAYKANLETPENYVFFPLVIHALDLLISGLGIMMVRSENDREDPLASMKRAYAICIGVAVVAFFFTTRILLYTEVAPSAWWHYGMCGLVGIICSYFLVLSTQFYTDYTHSPVKKIASASATGHGTNIIAGVSVGMESTAFPVLIISASLLAAHGLGATSGLPGPTPGLFGIAIATMGMLCTAVFILSMNNFGPIADNAGGIVEMSEQTEGARKITDRLDAVGNVTKAATKGYAVGGSALACFVLFQAFLDEVNEFSRVPVEVVDIAKIEVIVGGLIGIGLVFLFTGWAIDAVGRTAQEVVWEVRRQFKANPGIMEWKVKPEYGKCVQIVTKAALREMIRPATLALTCPVVIGFVFKWIGNASGRPLLGIEVLAAFLLFGTLTGLVMAIFLDNSGGAWDNCKKLIESTGGKGSETHKAAVTGDTVGDPFKDTAGPALHVIITTMSTTALVLGPMFIGNQ